MDESLCVAGIFIMIPLSELRLGNIFLHGGKIEKIVDYLSFTNTSHYEPIKLTPSILEQAGFNLLCDTLNGKLFIDKTNQASGIQFEIINDKITCEVGINDYMPVCCKYLHQLQNLYFHLTGQELPININTLKI